MNRTKKQRVADLARLMRNGPSLSSFFEQYTPERAEQDVKLWLESWVIPELQELVPGFAERYNQVEKKS